MKQEKPKVKHSGRPRGFRNFTVGEHKFWIKVQICGLEWVDVIPVGTNELTNFHLTVETNEAYTEYKALGDLAKQIKEYYKI